MKCLFNKILNPIRTFPADIVEWCVASLPRHVGFYSWLKTKMLNAAGARIGHNVHIYPEVRVFVPKGLVVGDNVSISSYVVITTAGTVTIGNNVLIGYGAKILSANHHIPENHGIIFNAGHDCKPIVIEDEVWMGANAVVLPGIILGRGSVVAAGAVVTKNVAPYTIVGGVPARLIRERN